MKTSKKRKLVGPVKSLNVVVTAEARAKLMELAGCNTMAGTVERIILRAHARQVKRLAGTPTS